jgi:hypothetical protein
MPRYNLDDKTHNNHHCKYVIHTYPSDICSLQCDHGRSWICGHTEHLSVLYAGRDCELQNIHQRKPRFPAFRQYIRLAEVRLPYRLSLSVALPTYRFLRFPLLHSRRVILTDSNSPSREQLHTSNLTPYWGRPIVCSWQNQRLTWHRCTLRGNPQGLQANAGIIIQTLDMQKFR